MNYVKNGNFTGSGHQENQIVMNRRKNDQSSGFGNQPGGSQGNPDSNRNRKGESPKTTTKDLKGG